MFTMLSPKDELDYYFLDDLISSPSPTKTADDLKAIEIHSQDTLKNRGQDVRLNELKQQLEIAESRCDTLKQQLDYMRNLYQGANVDQKPNKELSKRKGKTRNKAKKFGTESSLERKYSDPTLRKIMNRLPGSSSSSSKNSPHYQHKKGDKSLHIVNELFSDVNHLESYRETQENNGNELLIRGGNIQSRPASASSRPLSGHSKSPHHNSRPLSVPGNNIIYTQDSEDLSPHTESNDNSPENKLESTSSAVQVIHDILYGITNSVNRISQINVQIHEGGQSQNENKFYKNQVQEENNPKIIEVKENAVQTVEELNNQEPDLQSCSNNNFEQVCSKTQTVPTTAKKNKSRAGKRDIPPKLLSTYKVDSTESIHGSKRKAKPQMKPLEKRPKGFGPLHLHTSKRTRITEDVISVTTKIKKKKNPKLKSSVSKSTNNCKSNHHDITYTQSIHGIQGETGDSAPTPEMTIPYHVWHSDNVVELYHNSALLPADTSASDDTFTRYSHPSRSQEYPQKEKHIKRSTGKQKSIPKKQNPNENKVANETGFHISDDSGDEISPTEKIMKKIGGPVRSEVDLERALETPYLREPDPIMNDKCMDNAEEQEEFSTLTRSFQLPTVSSKLKEVDRNIYQRFNFRNIPFIAGTSTSPSHNLGLNIQQVLSIIKMRQPLVNSFPGMINRHLFGAKETNQVINELARQCSHISRGNGYGDIPEIPVKEGTNDLPDNSCQYGRFTTSRPATAVPFCHEGDEFRSNPSKPQTAEGPWNPDDKDTTNKDTKSNCNCFPTRRCVNYQKLLSQYLEGGEKVSFLKTPQDYQIPYKSQSLRHHYSTMSRMQRCNLGLPVMSRHSLKEGRITDVPPTQDRPEMLNPKNNGLQRKDPDFFVSIQGKAKSLKDVLTNLHSDFKRLNSKYEELQAGVTQDSVDEMEALKQLDAMESELQTKEEEITVVMALYKEVVSLKEQVRALRERTNIVNFSQRPATRMKSRRIHPREPTISVKLTRLLRTIQQFQDRLKHD